VSPGRSPAHSLRAALQWKNEHNLLEVHTMRRYHIQDRDDYKKYNKLAGMVTKLVRRRRRARAPAGRPADRPAHP
jgi:hypothetical protein